MTQAELDEVKQILHQNRSSCLCGHFESCSSCDGTAARKFKAICEKLDARFKVPEPKWRPTTHPELMAQRARERGETP